MNALIKRLSLIAAATVFLTGFLSAEEVVALLSSNVDAYQEALTGLEEELAQKVTVINVQKETPVIEEHTKVVVTFGGKAALTKIPKDAALIYCLAPTIEVGPPDHPGPRIMIRMLPKSTVALDKIKDLNPSLKTLAVLWGTSLFSDYLQFLEKEGSAKHIVVMGDRLMTPEDLPSRLRELKGKADAIWLLPDPSLVNQENLAILSEFSTAYKIPFYLPTSTLVKNGGGMSIAVSFKNIGREAGRWTKTALQGSAQSQRIYPENIEIAINLKTLNSFGIHLSEKTIKMADILIQ